MYVMLCYTRLVNLQSFLCNLTFFTAFKNIYKKRKITFMYDKSNHVLYVILHLTCKFAVYVSYFTFIKAFQKSNITLMYIVKHCCSFKIFSLSFIKIIENIRTTEVYF